MSELDRFRKTLVRLCLLGALALFLGGCGGKMVTVGFRGYNHIPGKGVTEFSINDTVSSETDRWVGRGTSWVEIPLNWRPGLKARIKFVHWVEIPDEPGEYLPVSRVRTVEIPEYSPQDAVVFNVHFYPGSKVKIIVARRIPNSMFYPMSKEDLAPFKPDPSTTIDFILSISDDDIRDLISDEDWKWARQWGLIKPGVIDPDASEEILEWLRPHLPETRKKAAKEYEAQRAREARDPKYAEEMRKARVAQQVAQAERETLEEIEEKHALQVELAAKRAENARRKAQRKAQREAQEAREARDPEYAKEMQRAREEEEARDPEFAEAMRQRAQMDREP